MFTFFEIDSAQVFSRLLAELLWAKAVHGMMLFFDLKGVDRSLEILSYKVHRFKKVPTNNDKNMIVTQTSSESNYC